MSFRRTAQTLTPVCWAIAMAIASICLATNSVVSAQTATPQYPYWDAYPFSLAIQNLNVKAYLTQYWPYMGSQELWNRALASAVKDMDQHTNLAASITSTPSLSSVSVIYDLILGFPDDNVAAQTKYYSYAGPSVGEIDCYKNYFLSSWNGYIPQCTLQSNLVTRAEVHVNARFPGWDSEGMANPTQTPYKVRRRVLTHELLHVPGHGHGECSLSTVSKLISCSGQQELSSHDTSWVNTRYPNPYP